ncbi:MAG: tetratricopeptide repeat protein [Candidatus Fervidibacter sp.]|uniref:tetratricopeptide repeat protein n=1 Tax=Candidatus Fervidibacter sp. TaxID=3100871 RepID=UPI00404909F1
MEVGREFEKIAAELESQGWHREAELLRRFPRSAWDDKLVKGMFVAAVCVRDISRAEKIAYRLVSFAPENPFAYLALSIVKLREGQIVEAAKAFDRALHFASTVPAFKARKIHWLCLQGKLEEAKQNLRETLKEYADRWEVQRARAHIWLSSRQVNRERLKRTIELLSRLVRFHPEDTIAHALLAQAFWKLGDRKSVDKHVRLMAKHLPHLTFTDVNAFIAWGVAKRTLADRYIWLRPNWLLEKALLRWMPPHYFVALGILWGMVALILAVAKIFLPTNIFTSLVALSSLAFVYNRFIEPLLLWLLKSERSAR